MRIVTRRRLAVLVVSLFSLAIPAAATAATLSGRVVDPEGHVVSGAHIVVSTLLGSVAERDTDEQGHFEISPLAAGRYDVNVLVDGFQADQVALTLDANQTSEIEIKLRLSAVRESVVVSASLVEVPLSRAPDSVTVITSDDIQSRQIETVGDALRLVPGLSVVRSGDRGSLTSLFPRGGGSNYTLVLIDGIRANQFGGAYDFGHLGVADIDRIEVVRGPESAVYGADAIGGVVQIVTRRGGRPSVNAFAERGNQATSRAGINAAGSTSAWSWGGSIEANRTDGYSGIATSTGEHVSNDDDHYRHGSGSVAWHRPSRFEMSVSGNISRDERGFPGPFGSNPIGAFTAVDRVSRGVDDTRQIGTRVATSLSSRVHQRIDVNVFDLSSDFTSPFGGSSSGTRRAEGRVQEDVDLSALSPGLAVSAGLDFLRERASSSFITGATGEEIPIQRSTTGVFGELRYLLTTRLAVTGGIRIEHVTRDAVEPSFDQFSPRPAFPDQSINSVNPKIAFSYLIAQSNDGGRATRLRASAGTGIRPPDGFEIAFTDNPNLRPERSRSVDGGIEQRLAGDALVIAAATFFNRYDDLLVTVGRSLQNASLYKTDNISNARARGLELSAGSRPLAALTLHASYTFLSTETLAVNGLPGVAPPPFKVGDPLIRRPRHQGLVDVKYVTGRTTVFADLTSRSQFLDVEPTFGASGGLFYSPGYTVVNAGTSVRIGHGIDIYARVLNLADNHYEETLGFPALRRSGMVGVRVAASR